MAIGIQVSVYRLLTWSLSGGRDKSRAYEITEFAVGLDVSPSAVNNNVDVFMTFQDVEQQREPNEMSDRRTRLDKRMQDTIKVKKDDSHSCTLRETRHAHHLIE